MKNRIVLLSVVFAFILFASTAGSAGKSSGTKSAGAGLPKDIASEMKEAKDMPKGTYTKVKFYEAETLMHGPNTGYEQADASASGKKSWGANAGKNQQGYLIYGPYEELKEGRYIAFFRVKLLGSAGEEPVVTIDACVDQGQGVLDQRAVTGDDLAKDKYVQVPLLFEYESGELETRVFWQGGVSILVDCITVFKLTK